MKKLYDGMQRFCAAHPRFGIPNLMRVIVIGNVAVYVLMLLTQANDANALSFLTFNLNALLHGEVWRLVTFVFVPAYSSPFALLISLYFYYWIGSTLERQWGTAKFNLYYISGALLTVLGVVLASLITGNPYLTAAGTGYVNLSMFFAFAFLFPDTTVLLFFILPVKMKWLAYLDGALFAFDIIKAIGAHNWAGVVLPIVALLNFAVFIWPEVHYLKERIPMILADKIVSLRKKAGWSQEDLAEKLGVTRQSVSKWEGAQSVPDMDKVVMMSRLFGVSTDFLLKDELEEEAPCAAAQDDDTPLRRVTMGQASAYLALRKAAAPKIAIATALCITSPVTLILLAGMSEVQRFHITENAASGIGLCVLLGLVALAVSIFLWTSAEAKEYRFLEEEPFETEYGVEGMVRQRQREYKDTHTRLVTVGVVLCVLAAVPLFAAMCINDGSDLLYIAAVCALLVLVAIGCLALVTAGVYQGAMEQLLEEGDYTRPQKKHHKLMGTVTMIYWLTATAVFLLYTYGPHGNGQPQYSWIIWAVAGVLYAAVMGIVRIISRSRG